MAKMPRLFSRALSLFVVLALLLVFIWLQAAPKITAQETASVSGTVSVASGLSINNFTVVLCPSTGETCSITYSQVFNQLGAYAINNVAPGDYVVRFEPYTDSPDYFAVEFYGGAHDFATAQSISVDVGEAVTGIDIELDPEATISGVITAPLGEIPYYTWLRACRIVGDVCSPVGMDTQVNFDGTYTLRALPAGALYLKINTQSPYYSEYYGGADDVNLATLFTLAEGETRTGVDIQLTEDIGITGKVTDGSGNPVADVSVLACNAENGDCWAIQQVHTDAQGEYILRQTGNGAYFVRFEGTEGSPTQYWPGVPNDAFAQVITTTRRSPVTNINAVFHPAGSVSGTLRDASSNPLPFASYAICWWDGTKCGVSQEYMITDYDGSWNASFLLPGNYRAFFQDNYYTMPGFEPEYYADSATLAGATNIEILPGATITGLDIQLSPQLPSYTLTGTVTASGGAPLTGIQVCLGDSGCGENAALSDANGEWTLIVEQPGFHSLQFSDPQGRYLDASLPATPNIYGHKRLLVRSGLDLGNLNVEMEQAAVIKGSIFDSSVNPLDNIKVALCRQNPHDAGSCEGWYNVHFNGGEGLTTYTIGRLPAGAYRVQFTDNRYPEQYQPYYYDDAFAEEDADWITITAGITSTVNAYLKPYGNLSGSITNKQGAPIQYHSVQVCRWDGATCESTYPASTDENGDYRADQLGAGNYRVHVDSIWGAYGEAWYGGTSWESAQSIPVADGATVTGIDLELAAVGTISGRLVDLYGAPAAYASIELCPSSALSNDLCWTTPVAYTNENGEYSIDHVPAGAYRLLFAGLAEDYIGGFYPGATTFANATIINVAEGQELTGYSAMIARQGQTAPTPTTTNTPTHTPTHTPTQTPTPTLPAATATPTHTATATPPGGNQPDAVAQFDALPNAASTATVNLPEGQTVVVGVPAGAVSQPTTLRFYAVDEPQSGAQSTFKLGGLTFSISATQNGSEVESFAFAKPVTLYITYRPEDVAGLLEEFLELRYYDAATNTWRNDGTRVISHDPDARLLVVEIDHLTIFGLGEGASDIFLPSVRRQ